MRENLYQSVVTNVPVVLFAIDRQGIFTLSEGKGLEGLDLKPGEVVGMSVYNVYKDITPVLESFEKALSGEFVRSDVQVGKHTFECFYAPQLNHDGNIIGVIGVASDITGRVEAEASLCMARKELEMFFTHTIDLICIADTQGTFVRLNPEWKNLLGYEMDDLTGKRFLDFIHPEDIPATLEALSDLSMQQPVMKFTNRYRRKDGIYRFLEWRAFPVNNMIYSVARDITERVELEKRLRKSERNYKELFEHSPLGIFQSTFDGHFVNLNNAFAKMLGYNSPKELREFIRLNDDLYADSDDRNRMISLLKEKGMVNDFQVRLIRKDLQTMWMSVYAKTLRDADTGDTIIDGFTLDITEQKKADEILVSKEAFGNELLALSRVFINVPEEELDEALNLALQKVGTFCKVDRAYLFQFDPDEQYMSNTHEWCSNGISPEIDNLQAIPCSVLPRWMEKLQRNENIYIPSVKDLPEHWKGEREILEPQGIKSLIVVPVIFNQTLVGFFGFDSVRQYRNWNSDEIRLLNVLGDLISGALRRRQYELELRNARARAEESDRLKSAFLANLSHEIRTPMNGIIGFTDLMNDPETTEGEKRNYLKIISENSNQLLSLINDLVDISKIEAGVYEVHETEFYLEELLQQLCASFGVHTNRKGLMLECPDVESAAGRMVFFDRGKLWQILGNLLSNAVKFTREGKISLGFRVTNNEILFHVKDTGPGIDPEHFQLIFQRFRRVETDMLKHIRGTGLGLAICKALVEQSGGRIWVESEPGKGSVFYFTIPYKPAGKTADGSSTADPKYPDMAGRTILVVEDEKDNFDFIAMVLRKEKVNYLHAGSGEDALVLFEANPTIDMVLMDLKLPGIQGEEVTKKMKSLRGMVPIIAQTAYAMAGDREAALMAGCSDYISKPMKAADLVSVIRRHLSPQEAVPQT